MSCRYTYQGKTYEAHEFDDVLRTMQPSEAARFMPGVEAVPAAPFVDKTEKWVGLAMKRMVRYAADNGFSKIAWTNGEQQAARYDLSKQVRRIEVIPRTDASTGERTRSVYIEPIGAKGIELGVDKDGRVDTASRDMRDAVGKHLSDVIGKEMADRVLSVDRGEFEGDGLRLGGEGMLAFYDRILPIVANDLLKKLGGGRVGTVDIGHVTRSIRGEQDVPQGRPLHVERNEMSGGWTIRMESELGEWWGSFRTKEEAEAYLPKLQEKYQETKHLQPGFDIAPVAPKARRPQQLFVDEGMRERATAAVTDLFTSQKTFNLWHRTVGTPQHKAAVSPEYRKVFDGVQSYLSDAAQLATRSADLAPDLLPKLEGWKGVTGRTASKDDLNAVSRAVFDGTLEDKVYTNAELAGKGLSPKAIELYRQARAAIDKSLDDAAVSEAVQQARGLVPQTVLDQAREAGDGWVIVNALSAIPHAERTPVQQQVYNQLRERMAMVSDLQRDGYAPLMRFGQYTVTVRDPGGEVSLFLMFESEREANNFARAVRPKLETGQRLEQGVLSESAHELFQGLSPDTLEIFADSVGASNKELFQQYLKLATNNRSVLKQMLRRKEIPGFSKDLPRTLAQFVTSNARAASRNYHWSGILQAANDIPNSLGDVKDEAIRLVKYVQAPKPEAGALRSLLFIQFLGGSVASALTNATQPIMMTLPWLAQYGGAAKASARLMSGVKVALGGAPKDSELERAMRRATEQGVISPHEIAGLYAESIRSLGSNHAVQRFQKAWGSLFSLAEAWNRRITFAAAYQTAREQGFPDPYAFAARAVTETQGVYNRGNRPNWAQGPVGATIMTFKQYSIAYMEFLKRLPPQQRALALAILVVAAGLQGLPGADDLEDVIDTIAETLGYNFNSKKELREFAANTLGEEVAHFVMHGFSGLPGVPLDVSARLGLSNLIPGTGMLKRSTVDKGRDVLEVFGPAGGQVRALGEGFSAFQQGELGALVRSVAPVAVQNLLKGLDMAQTGFYRDVRGRRVIDVDAADAMIKAVGFQPKIVADRQRILGDLQQTIDLNRNVEASIADQWARGIVEHNPKAVQEARARLMAWNLRNPDSRIRIVPQQIHSRVKQLLSTRDQRFAKAAPPEMRQQVREALQ